MKIIEKPISEHKITDFINFKAEENSDAVAFIETKENYYMIRFDILEDFFAFKDKIKDEKILCYSYPGYRSLKTVSKQRILKLKNYIGNNLI